MKLYNSVNHCLIYIQKKANPDFWDEHWADKDILNIKKFKTDRLFVPAIKKYLPKESKILEGGCGRGQLVHALHNLGYNILGIDYASNTVRIINKNFPELDVRLGDVRSLNFIKNQQLDGYISAGVIEHFWNGYDPIIIEIARVLKKDGFLFLTFPYLSPLRKLKILLGQYPTLNGWKEKDLEAFFYQYALSHVLVQQDLEKYGFKVIKSIKFDGIKGFKDDIKLFNKLLQLIYDDKIGNKYLKFALDIILKPFAAHMIFFICKKVN